MEDTFIKLYNTWSRKKELFKPISDDCVRLYTCGPTVYNYSHIGNFRAYIFEDILRRTLEYFGYKVKHVMNVTDVGHLVSDADTGEDKMVIGARREGKTVKEIALYYEKIFFQDAESLNILRPHVVCRATAHVNDMIEFVRVLVDKGYAYEVEGNVYFEISKFPEYGKLSGIPIEKLLAGARIEVDKNKRHPGDFALWLSKSKFPNQVMQWDSPWGRGFPGWHIECTVLAIKYLGKRLDIHCGGIDHIPIHHTNEIAQAEAYLGHRWCDVWMHGEFLVLKRDKMSKSKEGFLDLRALVNHGFEPLHYRYFCLGAHYRQQLEFSFEGLEGAKRAYEKLRQRVLEFRADIDVTHSNPKLMKEYISEFKSVIADDINAPLALAVLWKVVKDTKLLSRDKLNLLLEFDRVLGLGFITAERKELPEAYRKLIKQREQARKDKNWDEADRLREELRQHDIGIKDTLKGTKWYWLK